MSAATKKEDIRKAEEEKGLFRKWSIRCPICYMPKHYEGLIGGDPFEVHAAQLPHTCHQGTKQ